MKIYNVFNSRNQLLASFTDRIELSLYIRREKRDKTDTTILVAEANCWYDFGNPVDATVELMDEIWNIDLFRVYS